MCSVDCSGCSQAARREGVLGEAGRDRTAPGQPPNSGDGLPEDEELRETQLPISYHWYESIQTCRKSLKT